MSDPLESFHESVFVKDVERAGGEAIKVYNRAGYPDRLCWLPTKKGIVWFWAEWKRRGKVPEPHQSVVHEQLRDKGHNVYVFDNNAQAHSAIAMLCS